MSANDNTTFSVNKRKTEKTESKWRSLFKFGKGKAGGGKGFTDKPHSSDSGKATAKTPPGSVTITPVDPLSSSILPPSSSMPNYSNPAAVTPGKTQVEEALSDNNTPSATEFATVPPAPIGESNIVENPPETTKSPTSGDKTPITVTADDQETEMHSSSQGKTRQRKAAEKDFRTAVENLQKLMLEIAGKGNPPFITTVVHVDNFDDFDKNVKEIGSAIDNFMDKRTELRAQKGQIKEIAQKWYKACFPFVKGGLGIASV